MRHETLREGLNLRPPGMSYTASHRVTRTKSTGCARANALCARSLEDWQGDEVDDALKANVLAAMPRAPFVLLGRAWDETQMYYQLAGGEAQAFYRWLIEALEHDSVLGDADEARISKSLSKRPRFGSLHIMVRRMFLFWEMRLGSKLYADLWRRSGFQLQTFAKHLTTVSSHHLKRVAHESCTSYSLALAP